MQGRGKIPTAKKKMALERQKEISAMKAHSFGIFTRDFNCGNNYATTLRNIPPIKRTTNDVIGKQEKCYKYRKKTTIENTTKYNMYFVNVLERKRSSNIWNIERYQRAYARYARMAALGEMERKYKVSDAVYANRVIAEYAVNVNSRYKRNSVERFDREL